ncbi:hypothetical protein BDV3_003295 [Batrachochytrium dendrobatidis]
MEGVLKMLDEEEARMVVAQTLQEIVETIKLIGPVNLSSYYPQLLQLLYPFFTIDSKSNIETWEEVVDPDIPPESSTIEILCSEVITKPKEKRQGITRQQRKQHSTLHKVHLLTLLSAALHRNAKCCNAMLQSMLMSLLPFHLIQGIETLHHPLYALERHCKQNQVIYPNGKKHIVGTFKGEPIYPRTHVQTIRSSESWKRFGYQIKSGESGVVLKQKSLADSSKSFNIEDQDMFIDSNETNGSVWLYGEWQTEPLEPLALIDGIIPRNDFGNIEIFHPRMIPRGAVHIRGKGACHIAKQLEIDYASAITGFQFGRGKPIPLLDGIIVTAENGEIILEGLGEEERAKRNAYLQKRQLDALGRWKRLTIGIISRARIFRDYYRDTA